MYQRGNSKNKNDLSRKVTVERAAENDTGSSGHFKDNRIAAGLIGKLQDKANQFTNTYPNPIQKKDNSEASNMVIQTKLVRDKLNVAGEDHTESNARRKQEKLISSMNAGGGYWTEEKFTIDVHGVQKAADPNSLVFLRTLNIIAKQTEGLSKSKVQISPSSTINLSHLVLGAILPMIELAEAQWAKTEGVAYPGPLSQDQLATRDNLLRERFTNLQRLKTATQQLNELYGKKLDLANRKLARQYHADLVTARIEMVKKLMLNPDLDLLRSAAMHKAGQQKANVAGVWKIGDFHVQDILHKLPKEAPPKYNLLTQKQFNYIMENPTPSEAKALGLYDKKK